MSIHKEHERKTKELLSGNTSFFEYFIDTIIIVVLIAQISLIIAFLIALLKMY